MKDRNDLKDPYLVWVRISFWICVVSFLLAIPAFERDAPSKEWLAIIFVASLLTCIFFFRRSNEYERGEKTVSLTE